MAASSDASDPTSGAINAFVEVWNTLGITERSRTLQLLGGMPSPNGVVDLYREDLTRDELIAAMKDKVVYPETIVSNMDPEGTYPHNYGLVSFNILPAPIPFEKDDPDTKVVGFVKLRGAYPDKASADRMGVNIMKNIDSHNVNLVAPLGKWVPIVSGKKSLGGGLLKRNDITVIANDLSGKTDDGELDKIQKGIVDQALTDEIESERELQRRKDNLQKESMAKMDKLSLDYYITQRIVEMSLNEGIKAQHKKIEDLEEKYTEVALKLVAIESIHPEYDTAWHGEASASASDAVSGTDTNEEYSSAWLDRNNEVRAERGIGPSVPSPGTFDKYNAIRTTFDDDIVRDMVYSLES